MGTGRKRRVVTVGQESEDGVPWSGYELRVPCQCTDTIGTDYPGPTRRLVTLTLVWVLKFGCIGLSPSTPPESDLPVSPRSWFLSSSHPVSGPQPPFLPYVDETETKEW